MGLFSYFSRLQIEVNILLPSFLFKMYVIKISQWCRTLVIIGISMFSVLFSRMSLGSRRNFNINQVTIFVLNRRCILKMLLCSVLFTTF